jgi:hypothetical protein
MEDAEMQIAWCTRSKWYVQRPCRPLARRSLGGPSKWRAGCTWKLQLTLPVVGLHTAGGLRVHSDYRGA